MILGISLSILIALVVMLAGMGVYGECYETWAERITVSLTVAFMIGAIVCGAIIGKSITNSDIEKEYFGFIAVKETYDAAVSNEKISGLERLEITKTAIEQNIALARKKVDMSKWYSFDITDENKELILGLQPIGID